MTDLKNLALKAVPEDETLTAQSRQDCLICMTPLPFETSQVTYEACCGKTLCHGCSLRSRIQHIKEHKLSHPPLCAFCRAKPPDNDQMVGERLRRRGEVHNDPIAAFYMGICYSDGTYGFSKSKENSLQWYERAVQWGCPEAAETLAYKYVNDKATYIMYMEKAAKGGCLRARCILSVICKLDGDHETAAGHALVAACAGDDKALDIVKNYFSTGVVSKNDFATALRSHQAAHDERKSRDREIAIAFTEFEKAEN